MDCTAHRCQKQWAGLDLKISYFPFARLLETSTIKNELLNSLLLYTGDGQRPVAGLEVQDPSLWDFASLNSLKPRLQNNKLTPAEAPKKETQKPMRSSRDDGWAHFPSVSQPSSATANAAPQPPISSSVTAQPQGSSSLITCSKSACAVL